MSSSSSEQHFAFDPVAAFLRRPLQEVVGARVPPLSVPAEPAPRSIPALRGLALKYAWAEVLDLSTSLLAASDDSPRRGTQSSDALLPHDIVLCTAYRAIALVQTRQIDRAADALSSLGDLSPNNEVHRYETYPELYGKREGSFVPFELRIVGLEIKVRRADATVIPASYKLKKELEVAIEEAVGKQKNLLVERRCVLLSALVSYHLKAQQYDAAVDVAQELVSSKPDASALRTFGRVLLYVGDFSGAENAFLKAQGLSNDPASRHVHNGMLLSARGRYLEALNEFEVAVADGSDIEGPHTGKESQSDDKAEVNKQNGIQLWVVAANNAAICLMHIGRLAEAIDRLEGALRKSPEVALDEGLVFNLSTMYDLAYPDSASEKKRVLQRLASRFGRQGFDLERIESSLT